MNNMSNRTKQIAWNYVLILVGTAVMALAIQCIYDRVGLVTGGFTGLTIIIRNITKSVISGGIPLWFANIVLNIPVYLFLCEVWKEVCRKNAFCHDNVICVVVYYPRSGSFR